VSGLHCSRWGSKNEISFTGMTIQCILPSSFYLFTPDHDHQGSKRAAIYKGKSWLKHKIIYLIHSYFSSSVSVQTFIETHFTTAIVHFFQHITFLCYIWFLTYYEQFTTLVSDILVTLLQVHVWNNYLDYIMAAISCNAKVEGYFACPWCNIPAALVVSSLWMHCFRLIIHINFHYTRRVQKKTELLL